MRSRCENARRSPRSSGVKRQRCVEMLERAFDDVRASIVRGRAIEAHAAGIALAQAPIRDDHVGRDEFDRPVALALRTRSADAPGRNSG